MLNKQQKENEKIVKAQRSMGRLRFSAIRLYVVKSRILYSTRTDARSIKARAESILIDNQNRLYDDLERTIRSMILIKVDTPVELKVCVSLLHNDKEVAALYISPYWAVVQFENDFFTIPKNAPILTLLNHIIRDKFGVKYL